MLRFQEPLTVLTDLRSDVDRIDVVRETRTQKPSVERAVAVDVHVRAKPGVTEQWLARLVECHVAHELAEASCTASECPLGLPQVTTSVAATATGFSIRLRPDDSSVVRELARRAQRLLGPGSLKTVTVSR